MIEYLQTLSIIAICFIAFGHWVSKRLSKIADSYLSEKSKNIATKEDIADITRSVEEVKNEYNLFIEEIRSRNSLKMAAIDKRLEVHQEAMTLCIQAIRKVHNVDEIGPHVAIMDDFYIKNCIYLTPKAREAFWGSYMSANDYKFYKRTAIESGDDELKADAKAMWAEITGAPNIIMKELELPPMSDKEVQGPRK